MVSAVKNALAKAGLNQIEVTEWRKSLILNGRVQSWEEKVTAGFAAAHKGYKGVVNDIEVSGIETESMALPELEDNRLEKAHYDVVIIGGGVVGCAIARELSRYALKIALLEKEEDLARHTTGRNDGMIHDGFAAKPGTKKAAYNVRGNRLYTTVCKELGIDFIRPGSLVLFNNPLMYLAVPLFISRARKNDVDGYSYLSRNKVFSMEPYVTPRQHGAFFLPSAGNLSPYRLTIAYAENAVQNGAEVFLNTAVLGFTMDKERIAGIKTNRGTLSARVVINAAGNWADAIAGYADDRFFSLHGRKGVDAILDPKTAKWQHCNMGLIGFDQAQSRTKGGGVVMTVDGNIIIGPTAREVPYREDYTTSRADLTELFGQMKTNTQFKRSDIITYFAGIRACTYEEDFIIESSESVVNLIHAAGIQSPGLASAPAIAEDVSKMCINKLQKELDVKPNPAFNPVRKTTPHMNHLPLEERTRWIRKNPAYGRIVCRCELVSEGEVRDALNTVIPVNTLDGIKKRTRVTGGRCQGGFCTPRILEIYADEKKVKMTEIHKKGGYSPLLMDTTKGDVDYSGQEVKNIGSELNEDG